MIIEQKDHVIELYDTIENLPIRRFQKFNKLQMLSSDVGSDFQDFHQRVVKVSQYIQKGMETFALKELENFNLSLFNGFSEVSARSMSFAVLVKRIDDKDYNDFSEDDLERCLEDLDKIGFSYEDAIKTMQEVKKN